MIRSGKIDEELKAAANGMPLKYMIDMIDYFMCHAKIHFQGEKQKRAMGQLQLACMIYSLRDLDAPDDGDPSIDWANKLRTILDQIKNHQQGGESKEEEAPKPNGDWMIDTLCPHCFSAFQISSADYNNKPGMMPQVGDGSLCTVCYEVARFDKNEHGDFYLRRFTDDESYIVENHEKEFDRVRKMLMSDAKDGDTIQAKAIFKLRPV